MPLAFFIIQAYGFEVYQFHPGSSCCRAEFDILAKVPEGTTKEQFRQMLQSLLAERFKLRFHYEQKEMTIFELTVGKKGPKMKESSPDAVSVPEGPWAHTEPSIGKDGCPVFPAGRDGRTEGWAGCNRWTGFNLSMQEIVKTLSFNLGRKVVDSTGLKGKYDIDITWYLEWPARAGRRRARRSSARPEPHTRRQGSTRSGVDSEERHGRHCGC